MISASGANALLKVVEEPPEHVIFIFATTEPEKIIGTIRSRTHHYPFRLLTPPAMKGLLERTVASENVHVDDTVYPMVIQAGGGSPRDTLSILDQLLAGAGPDGLTYEVARPLLGVTDVGLLDNTVDALASQDKAGLFRLVDDVIEAGHEPRRFAIDLLDRLRDLMILQAVPSALEEGLVSAPTDRGEVLTAQAQRFSGPQLAYLAETVNERVSSLRGATSPRLLLEILCAHLIVGSAPAAAAAGQVPSALPQGAGVQPSAPAGQGSAPAQRQPSAVASAQDPAAAAAAIIAQRRSRQAAKQEAQQQQSQQAERPQEPAQPQEAQQQAPQQQEAQEQQPSAPEASQPQAPERPAQPEAQPESQQEQHEQPQPSEQPEQQEQQPEPEQPQDLAAEIRGRWSDLRATIGRRNKVAEIMLAEARVLGVLDETLVLGHTTGALAERINSPGTNEVIVTVLKEKLSRELKVTCVIGTDPKAHGFTVPEPTQRTQWNPNQPQREAAEPDEEAESPAAKEPNNASDDPWGAPRQIGQQAPSSETTKEQPQPQHGAREKVDSRPPAEPQRSEAAPRGAAVPPKREARGSQWRSRIAQATQVAAQRDEEFSKVPKFGNGVPLPPEPGPDEGEFEAPPEEYGPPAGANGASESAGQEPGMPQQSAPQQAPAPQPEYTRADEEREMMEAAQNAGEMDHRNATEVAMELLAQELGARRL